MGLPRFFLLKGAISMLSEGIQTALRALASFSTLIEGLYAELRAVESKAAELESRVAEVARLTQEESRLQDHVTRWEIKVADVKAEWNELKKKLG